MGLRHVVVAGLYTDQCGSSVVCGLADESFFVVLLEDCCAAGAEDLYQKELEILNQIYCQVTSSAERLDLMGLR